MTTTDRRLATIEASLSPTERVVRWLAEAHAFGTFETWCQGQLRGRSRLPAPRSARA